MVGLGLSATYQFTGIGLPCPWRALTGTLCPFCGSTTMGVHLLHLDLAGAWAANPFTFSVGAGVGVAALFWLVEAAGGPGVRLPRWLADQRVWMSALGVIALTFTVYRNL